jgi:hypothetical protein
MDGINPTLAFAALLFGLSGNPQDTTHHSTVDAQVQERAGCALVDDPAQLHQGGDPIVRRSVPAASAAPALDPCAPKQ